MNIKVIKVVFQRKTGGARWVSIYAVRRGVGNPYEILEQELAQQFPEWDIKSLDSQGNAELLSV